MPIFGHGLRVSKRLDRIEGVWILGTNRHPEPGQSEYLLSHLFPWIWLAVKRIEGVVFRFPVANRIIPLLLPLPSPSSSSPFGKDIKEEGFAFSGCLIYLQSQTYRISYPLIVIPKALRLYALDRARSSAVVIIPGTWPEESPYSIALSLLDLLIA